MQLSNDGLYGLPRQQSPYQPGWVWKRVSNGAICHRYARTTPRPTHVGKVAKSIVTGCTSGILGVVLY